MSNVDIAAMQAAYNNDGLTDLPSGVGNRGPRPADYDLAYSPNTKRFRFAPEKMDTMNLGDKGIMVKLLTGRPVIQIVPEDQGEVFKRRAGVEKKSREFGASRLHQFIEKTPDLAGKSYFALVEIDAEDNVWAVVASETQPKDKDEADADASPEDAADAAPDEDETEAVASDSSTVAVPDEGTADAVDAFDFEG